MAVFSRSPFEFQQRAGLLNETFSPGSRLAVDSLLVHREPLEAPHELSQQVLAEAEGDPPPDRGMTHPWPNQTDPNKKPYTNA